MLSNLCAKHEEQLYETPIIHQTAWWSDVKKRIGVQSCAFNFKVRSNISGKEKTQNLIETDMLVMIEPIDRNQYIAYVPHGPEWEPDAENLGEFLEELSESLIGMLPPGCILIRYDLLWRSLWIDDADFFDEKGNWTGPPKQNIQELRFNFNTINWNFHKSWSNILPSNTIFVDLKKSEEDLLQAMKPKTRYNIRLSERKGVHVKTLGIDQIEIWYKLYSETARRNGIFVDDLEYFRAVFKAKASCSLSPAEVYLLVAQQDANPLAAMFLVISGKRATYLYGASSSQHRNLMAPYALQWEAMRLAKAKDCTDYDMFGVAPNPDPEHPMYGLYRFKTGFGGQLFHALGCWDYPIDQETYKYFRAWEMKRQGYHLRN